MEKLPLTEKQQEIKDWIYAFANTNDGVCPRSDQIADRFELGSQGVYHHMRELVKRGWLESIDEVRGWRIP